MKSDRAAAVLLCVVLLCVPAIPARAVPPPGPSREELLARVQQLEAQLEQMRSELATVRQQLTALAGEADRPAPGESSALLPSASRASSPGTQASAAAKREPSGFSVGAWNVRPYGTVYFNAFGNSGGSNNADVPLFAAPGAGSVSASARQTRLGVRVEGPQWAGRKLSGVFEADFFGGFPAIGVGEDFGVVRLRLAYARLDGEHASFEAGQDWMVYSPNNPVSIAAAAIPLMTSAGNLWSRLPQIRAELHGGSRVKWLGQAAVLAPATGDFPATPAATFLWQPGAGARSRVPYFQARAATAVENWFGLDQPATLGASLHYGRARVTVSSGNVDLDSVGAALDWNLPLLPHVALSGEAFFGRNLAGFQGAIFQGVNPDFAIRSGSALVPGGARGIGTRGGWAQLGFTPRRPSMLSFYASYGLDDPRNSDLVSLAPHDWRLRNQSYAFSFLHKPMPQLTWGVEFRRMETQFLQSGHRNNNHVNLGVTLNF